MKSKLGLGTAQFGLNYGIANSSGQPNLSEVRSILQFAHSKGIELIDTAAAYGSSEVAIGGSGEADAFKIVTKIPKLTPNSLSVTESLNYSCQKLKVERVYGLLFHHVDDLLGPHGKNLWKDALELKKSGLVTKIGASIYSPDQVDSLLTHFRPDLIQVPLNLFDQRLIHGGQLKKLKSFGVEIHVRSVFLQGVLLMDPKNLPDFLGDAAPPLKKLQARAEALGLSPLQFSLGFVLGLPEVDCVIVGVDGLVQFQQILDQIESLGTGIQIDRPIDFAVQSERVINPVLWPAR